MTLKQSLPPMPCLFFILLCMVSENVFAQHPTYSREPHIDWKDWFFLPPTDNHDNPGVAGAFAGISKGALFIVGGANFPYKPVWEGGAKKYWDKIYVMPIKEGKPTKWIARNFSYPYAVAYGASLSINEGILCIGGKNDEGFISDVNLMIWNGQKKEVQIKKLPSLPQPLASLMVTRIGQRVYAAGGDDQQGSQHVFYCLNLKDLRKGWSSLPAWPGPPLADGVLITQSDGEQVNIYLIGGRNSQPGKLSLYYNTVYEFDPVKLTWEKRIGIINSNGKEEPLFAGTGIAVKDHYIILFGGNDGRLFTEIERCTLQLQHASKGQQRVYWKTRMDSIFIHHPGFDKKVYCYNTVKNTWSQLGELPFPSQLTTTCFRYLDEIIIPSGEVRPGIRTSRIISGKIE
jgi:solute:Na+ symporter, SSS family